MRVFPAWIFCITSLAPVTAQSVSYPDGFDEPFPTFEKASGGRFMTGVELQEDFEWSWARSDTWIRGSRF